MSTCVVGQGVVEKRGSWKEGVYLVLDTEGVPVGKRRDAGQ